MPQQLNSTQNNPQPKGSPISIYLVLYFILVALIIAALAFSGYVIYSLNKGKQVSNNAQNTTTGLFQGKIKMGVGLWPGNLGFYVAEEKGFFQELGLDVDITIYESLTKESEDYKNGEIVGRGNLTLDAIKEAQSGIDHKVILAVDYSNGADGIVALPAIKNFKDIKGKKVALEMGTLEEFFFQYALEQNGMDISEVNIVNLDPEKSAEAVIEKTVDAAVTYEPFLSNALEKTKGNMIYSSKDSPGLIVDNLTFKTEFIEKYPETIKLILKAYFKALEFAEQNPDEAHEIVARATKDTKENVAKQLANLILLDEGDNKIAFTFSAGIQSLYTNMRKSGEFIQAHGEDDTKIDTDKLVESEFIKNLGTD